MRRVNTSQTHRTQSDEATRELAQTLAAQLVPGDLVALSGPLGAGKTTFTQGLARGLGVLENITSPTFVLMTEYSGRVSLAHLDAYRLEGACYDAVRDAGVPDLVLRDDAVQVIEWPEFVADWLPAPRFLIRFEPGGNGDERIIEITENPQ